MSDIKEKLRQLKKEREARSRSQMIKDRWDEIGKEESLSVKEKLDRLISLIREEKPKSKKPVPFEPLKIEALQLFENPFPLHTRYGKIVLSSGLEVKGEILSCLSRDEAFTSLDLSTALFIDLETTGLSGGTGVVPFLVGMGYYSDEKFWITQFFLGDLAEEERMIAELSQFFSQMNFQSLVTYNGKGFDLPLLETRFILHRQPFPLSSLPHLDFLYSARSLWRHKHLSCQLFHLSREVVEADRSEDIPSAEIPWRYFQYLKTGNFDLMEPVLYHNQEDILSLLGVVVIGSLIFSEERQEEWADAMDLYGAGRIMENIGKMEKSVRFYRRALEGKLEGEISLLAKRKISHYLKKKSRWEDAVSLWSEIASSAEVSSAQLYSLRELAMHFEHRLKDYEEARRMAEEGLVLSQGFSSYYERDFAHRLERLKRKLRRKKERASR
ncbi:MAG: ribonuclease H-like domain-containing protein [Candidatus Aminicenantales bacterium]